MLDIGINRQAHPCAQEHIYRPMCASQFQGSSLHTRNSHFPTRGKALEQPENIQFPVEMSRQFLTYGDHASIGVGS